MNGTEPWPPPAPTPAPPPPNAPTPVVHAPKPRSGVLPALGAAFVALVLLTGAAFGVWTLTDLDGDALTVRQEWDLGTDPVHADSDRDRIPDGWEVERSLDPLDPDSDGDGLSDPQELRNRSNPLSADTDQDGLLDGEEGFGTDCDGNGFDAVREDDDDADERRDADELVEHRCDPDVDGDGVLDGREGAELCVTQDDCDTDGLLDGYEANSSFNPLNPDTFGVGLEDAILDAFQRRGQPPSGDADRDGIPDGWEGNSGLIDWGAFAPTNDTRDLLVEFVRVSGPDSGRHAALSFASAYDAVKALFQREANIRLQWIETPVSLPQELLPSLIPSSHSSYYLDILAQSKHATNPYVTTIVMNPQHDQSQILHAGVAPIRGMLAAVDYGVEVTLTYRVQSQNLRVTPLMESAIEGNRLDLVRAMGFTGAGKLTNGDMFLDAGDYIIAWTPHWFRTPPRIVTDEGDTFPTTFQSATVDTNDLAFTIAHELGHTLGLCHLDLSDCLAGISQADRATLSTSTMHPLGRSLHFLPSEWNNIGRYMGCPPHGPVRLLASDAAKDLLIEEKYGYALTEILNVSLRQCGDFSLVERNLEPYPVPVRYEPPAAMLGAPVAAWSTAASVGYLLGAAGFVAIAAFAVALLVLRRSRPG